MRLFLALAALALSTQGWSASMGACSNSDAASALAKVRQYILPAPNAPQHRWMVSKAGDGWTITEYNGLRVFVRCQPMTKADELNGVQHGEVEFQYDVSRTTDLPEVTSAGLQWDEWSEWVDHPKPMDKAKEAETAPLVLMIYRLALASDSRDRHVTFRKYKGKIQLDWEFNERSGHPEFMTAVELNRFLSTADAEAAKLRLAEAEQAQRVQEPAEAAKESRYASDSQQSGDLHALGVTPAKMARAADPDDYYPPGSIRREEQGSPVVRACVGANGRLLREPIVTDTSGFPDLDVAAIKVAKATRYLAGKDERGAAFPESCLKFKVKFTLKTH